MTAQVALQKKLSEVLTESRLRNPAYSLRAFAKKLDLSPSAVSEILNGKRNVSKKLAEKVVHKLCLDPRETKSIIGLFEGNKIPQSSAVTQSDAMAVSMDHFHLISDWYHSAILSLSETKDFSSEPTWIAKRLNIKVLEAKSALERLERLGLMERDARGKLKATHFQFQSPDEISSVALRKAHLQKFDLAKSSLERDKINERDFTAMTLAMDISKLPIAKKMIREFRDRLTEYLESGPKTQVYELCVQLFPLSDLGGEKIQ